VSNIFEIEIYNGLEIPLDENFEPWLTRAQIAEMLGISRQRVEKVLSDAYEAGELEDFHATTLLHETARGSREVNYYNLDAILLVGFRSKKGKYTSQFRTWATSIIRKHLQHERDARYEAELKAHFATVDLEARWEQELRERYPQEDF
jgi:hypothetical protein